MSLTENKASSKTAFLTLSEINRAFSPGSLKLRRRKRKMLLLRHPQGVKGGQAKWRSMRKIS